MYDNLVCLIAQMVKKLQFYLAIKMFIYPYSKCINIDVDKQMVNF